MVKRKAKRIEVKPMDKITPQSSGKRGFQNELPPDKEWVIIYFYQKDLPAQAELFYQCYTEANWKSPRGTPFRSWKALAANWIYDYLQEIKLKQRISANSIAMNDM